VSSALRIQSERLLARLDQLAAIGPIEGGANVLPHTLLELAS
jgi:hypothetical protein